MKNLEACQCDPVETKPLNDRLTVTDGYPQTANDQIDSPRQWYWFGLAIVALAFVAEMALTWRKWSNIGGDLGLDLYIPWRLSQGAVLYRDVFFFAGGPLSQYFDALLFKIFGASFLVLALSNLAAIALLLLVLFRRFEAAADTWTAATICLGVTIAFAFGYYFYEGFNYVMPYSDEALHGLLLSVITVGFLSDLVSQGRLRWAILAGFCTGLVFLAKPDIFIALTACDITAFGLLFFSLRKTGIVIRSLGAFLAAGIIPALLFFFYFFPVENWHDSIRSIFFGWAPMFHPAVVKCPYYQWCTGLDQPAFHLRNMLCQFAIVTAVTAFYAVAFRTVKRREQDWSRVQQRAVPVFAPVLLIFIYADHWHQTGEAFSYSFVVMLTCLWLLLIAGILALSITASRLKPAVYRSPWAIVFMLATPLWTAARDADWVDCGYSLPLIALVSCALIYWNRRTLAEQQKFIFPFLWAVFALVMLSKLGFFSRIWHYGFVLAMPAFVIGIYCLLWLLPPVLEKKWQVPALLFRGVVWVVLIIAFASLFRESERGYAQQNIAVSDGNNRMLASDIHEHAKEFNAALAWIDKNVPQNATIAVLPQGAELNFLSHRINPTPCVAWDPNYVAIFGESRMTDTYEKSPPDYIVIVERRFKPIDTPYFGSPGYGGNLMQWVSRNYRTQILIGHEPLKNGLFGIKILKRLSEPSSVSSQPFPVGHQT